MQWRFCFYVVFIQMFYTLVQIQTCRVLGVSILKLPWCTYLWDFLFVIFHYSTEHFASLLKLSRVELCYGFPFTNVEVNHKVLIFGSKSSKLRNNCKYNCIKKVKSIVNILVSDKFDTLFQKFILMNSCILGKVNFKGSR